MMHLSILTPDKQIFDADVDMVSVPSSTGILGILPKHTDLFANLTEGILQIKTGTNTDSISIGGGFVKVEKNQTIVLVSRAVGAAELDEKAITQAREEAKAALSRKPTGNDLLQNQAILRQSLFDMKLLRKHRNKI